MDYPAIIETPENIIANENMREAALKRISDFVENYVPDVESEDGRKDIRSLAFKITKTKTAVDEAGKASMEQYKKAIADITAVKNDTVARLEKLRDKFREPLTKWEEAEKKREEDRKAMRKKLDNAQIVARGTSSYDIEERIQDIIATVPDNDDFKEAKAYCLSVLRSTKIDIEADEKREEERKELAAKQAAIEAEKREFERKQAELEEAVLAMRRENEALQASLEAAQAPKPEPIPEPEPVAIPAPTPEPAQPAPSNSFQPFHPEPHLEVRKKLEQIMHPQVANKLITWIENGEIGLRFS